MQWEWLKKLQDIVSSNEFNINKFILGTIPCEIIQVDENQMLDPSNSQMENSHDDSAAQQLNAITQVPNALTHSTLLHHLQPNPNIHQCFQQCMNPMPRSHNLIVSPHHTICPQYQHFTLQPVYVLPNNTTLPINTQQPVNTLTSATASSCSDNHDLNMEPSLSL